MVPKCDKVVLEWQENSQIWRGKAKVPTILKAHNLFQLAADYRYETTRMLKWLFIIYLLDVERYRQM